MNNISDVLRRFGINASEIRISRIHTGHVNETFKVCSDCGTFILQKINTNVFSNPEKVMHNIKIAQNLIRRNMLEENKNPDGKFPEYLVSDGRNYLVSNGFWRIYRYIDSIDLQPDEVSIREFGRLLGEFHRYTHSADTSKLYVTIDDFHNIEKNISAAVECDGISQSTASLFSNILSFYFERKSVFSKPRLVHNDVKWANVLINPETRLPEAIIDYDTVMSGYAAFDFGDAVRSACVNNDYTINLQLLRSFATGYNEEYNRLCPEEKALGILAISAELSARYLYYVLSKSNYFPTLTKSQKLEKHENMLSLTKSIFDSFSSVTEAVR